MGIRDGPGADVETLVTDGFSSFCGLTSDSIGYEGLSLCASMINAACPGSVLKLPGGGSTIEYHLFAQGWCAQMVNSLSSRLTSMDRFNSKKWLMPMQSRVS